MNILALFLICSPFLSQLGLVQAISVARDTINRASIIHTLDFSENPHDLTAASSFQVEFEVPYERRRVGLNLQPTRNVLSHLTNIQHMEPAPNHDRANKVMTRGPMIYKGEVYTTERNMQKKVGWARVMLRYRDGRHTLEGAFTIGGNHHHISLGSTFQQTQPSSNSTGLDIEPHHMVIWKESSNTDHLGDGTILQRSSSDASSCAAQRSTDRLRLSSRESFDQGREHDQLPPGLLQHSRRQNIFNGFNPVDVIGSTDGCPSSRRVALLGIAADCTYTAEFDSMQDARENIISQVNIASQVYEDTFNIALSIQNLTISDPSCPSDAPSSMPWNLACTANVDISGRLNLFSEWRREQRDDNAAWSLLTTCRSGSTVGIAWIGSLCNRARGSSFRGGGSSAASANVVSRTSAEWQVFAHELAHNFGASHDCTASTCGGSSDSASGDCCPLSRSTCDARDQYLMNPSSSPGLEEFSPCTIGTVCTGMREEVVDASCLVSEDDVPDINDSQCGNGIVEAGETCDCGGEDGCPEDSCCNPSTCQLRRGAECDPTTDGCCTDQCQVAPSRRICRPSTGSCDPEETCDGSSSQCPVDEQNCSPDDENFGGRGGGSEGSWIDRNRTTVIAVSASVGGFIILVLAACLLVSCMRRKRRKEAQSQRQRVNTGDEPPIPAVQPTAEVSQLPTSPRMVHRYA